MGVVLSEEIQGRVLIVVLEKKKYWPRHVRPRAHRLASPMNNDDDNDNVVVDRLVSVRKFEDIIIL